MNGVCSDQVGSFYCVCENGFTGEFCNTGVSQSLIMTYISFAILERAYCCFLESVLSVSNGYPDGEWSPYAECPTGYFVAGVQICVGFSQTKNVSHIDSSHSAPSLFLKKFRSPFSIILPFKKRYFNACSVNFHNFLTLIPETYLPLSLLVPVAQESKYAYFHSFTT